MKKKSFKKMTAILGASFCTMALLLACDKGAGTADDNSGAEAGNNTVVVSMPTNDDETHSASGNENLDNTASEIDDSDLFLEAKEGFYRSELTNEWIDESLKNQRPVCIMVDNELTALDHYGINQADVVYEMMNSTANGRVTRLMCVVKDWANIEQFGSIRSTRPTNVVIAGEWNGILIHDGGPFYINDYLALPFSNNISGGFARFSNGKATEFTEYVTYDSYTNPNTGKTYPGLADRIKAYNYSTEYNKFYPGEHWNFASGYSTMDKDSKASSCSDIQLPFPHNQSELKYNESTKKYEYYEYGKPHIDKMDNDNVTSFTNVILEARSFIQYDENGYLIYNITDSTTNEGYYITRGVAVPIKWEKKSFETITHYYYKSTGKEIDINTGKTYIAYVPSDSWSEVIIK